MCSPGGPRWWLCNENRQKQFFPPTLIYFCQSIIPAESRDYKFLNPGSRDWEKGSGIAIPTHMQVGLLFATTSMATIRGFGNLRTANWRTGNMRTNMRTRPLIGRDVTCVPHAVRKVPHGVRSSHCFVSRPNEPYCSNAESRCICIFMTTVFGQLFVSVT